MKTISIIFILCFIGLINSLSIQNIHHQISIQSLSQYIQYIQALNGLATQQDFSSNSQLMKIVKNQRISLLNPLSGIVLVLTGQTKPQGSKENLELEEINQLNQLNRELDTFDIISLIDLSKEQLTTKLEEIKKSKNFIHVLEVSVQTIKQLQNNPRRKLQEEESSIDDQDESQQRRQEESEDKIHKKQKYTAKLAKDVTKNPTYIMKFFFALLFIIVSLGSLIAIANMENKKDTLLYAKFIADVGVR